MPSKVVNAMYSAWYEWYPAYQTYIDDFDVQTGDLITVTMVATSTTSGTATLSNNRSGQTYTITLTDQPALCLQNAEWIVEDFDLGGEEVPFANFGGVVFTGASATTVSGHTFGPANATIYEVVDRTGVVASAAVSTGTVTVFYQ
jgi:hypothetical protein